MMLPIGKREKKLNRRGFTLLELMLVAIIVAILSTLSFPIFKNSFSNLELSNTSYNLARLMRYAQERSIVERINYQLHFNSQLTQFWLTKEPDPLKPGQYIRLSGKISQVTILPRNIKIKTENYLVNFYPDGQADKATIYLSNQKEKYFTITTKEKTGYVQLLGYKAE